MSDLDPRLGQAFAALRAESAAAPHEDAIEAARAAMHQARVVDADAGAAPLSARLRAALTTHRLMAVGTGAAAGLAVVAALGWNAPSGSPLHAVRVAHEQIALALPGSDRVALDLGFAESRLGEASQDGSAAALDEAQGLLDDARAHLVAGAPLWSRWQADEKELGELRHGDHDGGQGSGGSDEGSGSGGGSTSRSQGGSTTSSEHEGGASASTTSSSHDGGGSTTTTTTTMSESSSASTGGDGGGSSSTSSSSSSSSSDGGGSGADSGGGGGGSSSSSTTTGSETH